MPEVSYNDIEDEFGVSIRRSVELGGTVEVFTCQVPGSTLWARGTTAAELRDQLIRHKWLADAGGE